MAGLSEATGVPSIELNDGNKMPILGFGTSRVLGSMPGDPGYEAVKLAIETGYRFIDTAALYENEEAVGRAIADCIGAGVVKRDDLFICTKVWCTAHRRRSVMQACRDSLGRLGLNYVDLYLIHWPMGFAENSNDPYYPRDLETGKLLYSDTHYTETWLGMEDVKEAGLARSIGLSNFNHQMTNEILALPCRHKPAVIQQELHPYLSQEKLIEYSKIKGIALTAYCPLGSSGSLAKLGQPVLLEDPIINEIARKHKRSSGQVAIRYHIERGVSVIPKSIRPARIVENFDVLNFALDEHDMSRLMALNRNLRYCPQASKDNVSDHPLYPFHVEY